MTHRSPRRFPTHLPLLAVVCALAGLLLACDTSINRPIHVADGETVRGGLTSVNGSIDIGRKARVTGAATTVNGGISVDDEAQVEGLMTVNGSLRIGSHVKVDGDVESVNGSLRMHTGSEVAGDVETVNGSIELDGAFVRGKIETYNGSVTLRHGSRVDDDVVINRSQGNFSGGTLEIRILDGSVVAGDVMVEDKRRKVRVVLEGGGAVQGEVRGAEVVRGGDA